MEKPRFRVRYKQTLVANTWSGYLSSVFRYAKQREKITLDISNFVSFGLAEALSLPLIANSQRRKGVPVSVKYQDLINEDNYRLELDASRAFQYLVKYDVTDYLDEVCETNNAYDKHGVELLENEKSGFSLKKMDPSAEDVKLPLTKITGMQSVVSLQKSLELDKAYEKFGKGFTEGLRITASGDLGRVLVYELGQNIVEHAFDKDLDDYQDGEGEYCLGFVAFQKTSSNPSSSSKNVAGWQRLFFDSLEREGYFRVAVGDNGMGIQNSLLSTYCKEKNISREEYENDKYRYNVEILKWAFLENTSCKPYRKSGAFAGLARVKNRVQRNNGLLSVCSCGVRIVWDFSKDSAFPVVTEEVIDDNFEGTLYDIVFPLLDSRAEDPVLYAQIDKSFLTENLDSQSSEYCRISSTTEQAEVIERVQKSSISADENNARLIIDTLDTGNTWNKHSLDYFTEALSGISSQVMCFVFGMHENYYVDIQNNEHIEKLKNRIICAVDIVKDISPGFIQPKWITLSETDAAFLNSLYSSSFGDDFLHTEYAGIAKRLCEKNNKWISKNASDVYHTVFDLTQLVEISFDAIRLRMSQEILDVVDKDQYCYVKGRYYAKSFVPIHSLMNKRNMHELVVKGIFLSLNILSAEKGINILCASSAMGSLITEEFSSVGTPICFESTQRIDPDIVLSKCSENESAILLLDVIGNGSTISKLASAAEKAGKIVKGAVAIVDTRKEREALGLGFDLIALSHFPIDKWGELDDDDTGGLIKAYENGRLDFFDVDSHIVIHENRILSLYGDNPLYFWNNLYEFGAVTHAHKIVHAKGALHHPYYIDPSRPFNIMEANTPELEKESNILLNDLILNIEKHIGNNEKIETVIYPTHYETEVIATNLGQVFKQIKFIGVKKDINEEFTSVEIEAISNKSVLVFDSATNTGETLSSIGKKVVRASPNTLSIAVILNRIDQEDILARLKELRFSKGVTFFYAYETRMPCFDEASHPCPLCRVSKDYEELHNNRDGNGYTTTTALEQCKQLVETYGERDLRQGELSEHYWQRIEFWGLASSGDLPAIRSFLKDILASARDANILAVIKEYGRLVNILYICANSDSTLREKYGKDKYLVEQARLVFADCTDNITRYRLAKFLSYCNPVEFLSLLNNELKNYTDTDSARFEDVYFLIVDGMRDIERSHRSELSQIIHNFNQRYPNSSLFMQLKEDRMQFFNDVLHRDSATIEKRRFWEYYNGNNGPSHTTDAYDLLALTPNPPDEKSNDTLWEIILAAFEALDSIRKTADNIVRFLPAETSDEYKGNKEIYEQVERDLSHDSNSLLERNFEIIREVASKHPDDYVQKKGDLEEAANVILDLIYRSSGHKHASNSFAGNGHWAVTREFAGIKDTIINIVYSLAQCSQINCDEVLNSGENVRSLISRGHLADIIRGIIANALKYGGNCIITCDLDCNPAKISFEDDGSGFSEEQLNGVFDPGFLAKISEPKRKRTGYDLKISNSSQHSGACITVYLDSVMEDANES